MKKVWMCFRLDFGTTLHAQDKWQPWPAKLVLISDAQFSSKKEAENDMKKENIGKGFYFVHKVFIQS